MKHQTPDLTPKITPNLSKFLDIDYLKSFGKTPQWFGLGFIQLKLDKTRRLHFWDPTLAQMVNDEEMHDHRYDFTSTVLAGSIDHTVYAFSPAPDGDHELCDVYCQPEKSQEPLVLVTGFIHQVSHQTFTTGDSYTFPQGAFHKGVATSAVTYVERGEVVTESARIIRPKTAADGWTCPFTAKLSEDDAWAAIENILAKLALENAPLKRSA